MRYLIYNSEALAQAATTAIFNTAMQLYTAEGRAVDTDGLVGTVNGVDAPDKSHTSRWDKPVQRLDGKWIISHPENHPAAEFILPNEATALSVIMAQLGAVVEEERSDAWFTVAAI